MKCTISYQIKITCLILILIMTNRYSAESQNKPTYPGTRRETVADTLHGVLVEDPYRWLEDDRSAETKDWVRRQNGFTRRYLDKIPFREEVKHAVTELLNHERMSAPIQHGPYLYFFHNDGLQDQSIFFRQPAGGGKKELVLDPNTFSQDGTSALGAMAFSRDNRYLAYQVSEAGSDWKTIYVLDLHTLKATSDKVSFVKFSGISWKEDGFYYSRYPAGPEGRELTARADHHSLYYHQLGTSQSEDRLIYRDEEDPLRNVYARTSKDERWLILSIAKGTSGNRVLVRDLQTHNGDWVTVNASFDCDYNFVGNVGATLFFYTNEGAPNYKVISVDLSTSLKDKHTLLPEGDAALTWVKWHRGRFYCHYLVDAKSDLVVFDQKGTRRGKIELPGPGTLHNLQLSDDMAEGYFTYSSFIRPATIYKLQLNDLSYTLHHEPKLPFHPDDYISRQYKYKSYDGTEIPVFISYRKDIAIKGDHPTLLYGYGGFNIPITPSFSSERAAFMQMGGVYAVANIRGGGEYGEAWHKAGTLAQKQNVFNDFQAAAEYLIDQGWAMQEMLAIEGRSNGGLLAGACLTQRPDLYKVVFPIVGVLDMLRYHLFTIGWAWASDYGKSDDPQAFAYLRRYSPYHNVRPAFYPSTMVMTADHDDRVVPAHSFKFAAALQHEQRGDRPILIRIDHNAGHGAGKSISLRAEEMADKLSFLWYEMGLTPDFD